MSSKKRPASQQSITPDKRSRVFSNSSKLHSTVKKRYSSSVTYLDTQDPDVGIIENKFKGSFEVTGQDIERVKCFFENIQSGLIGVLDELYGTYGRENIYILGCVAWFSNEAVISQMAKCAGCIIVINDEDLSGPSRKGTVNRLATLPKIKVPFKDLFRFSPNDIMKTFNNTEDLLGHDTLPIDLETGTNGFGRYGPIVTIGSRPVDPGTTSSAFQQGPIQHSKYLIICVWYGKGCEFVPIAVWTGSINLTEKARTNQENGVYMESLKIAAGYYEDFVNSFQASLPPRV